MKIKRILFIFVLFFFHASSGLMFAQPADFNRIVAERLKSEHNLTLEKVCPIATDAIAAKIFSAYGAVFLSKGTLLPDKCIFTDEADLKSFQNRTLPQRETIDGIVIELQKPAMEALLKARREAAQKRLLITPNKDISSSARRSLAQTVTFWNQRVKKGLAHWVGKRSISTREAKDFDTLSFLRKVEKIFEWEGRNLFFSTWNDKSIVYSVALPGASQHNFMLALDVKQHENKIVQQILADNGWFQTVKSDAPHFTYLGVKESELPALGLKTVSIGKQKYWIPSTEQ